MTKILVTGGSGFVGRHVVEALSNSGNSVRCLVRKRSSRQHLEAQDVDLVDCELDDEDSLRNALKGVSTVYHVAGATAALNRSQLFDVNEKSAERIVRLAAQQLSPPTVVLVSSLAAAGPTTADRVRVESDPPEPISLYGKSKLAGEQAARLWADKLPLTIIRPSIVFGPHDVGIRPLMRLARGGRVLLVAGHRPRLSFIHVADLAQMMLRAAQFAQRAVPETDDENSHQGVYFAADGRFLDLLEAAQLWNSLMGRRPPAPYNLPRIVAWPAAVSSELVGQLRRRPHLFNRDKLREATVGSWACSGRAADRDFQYHPASPLIERFRQTIEWYQEHKQL